MRRYAFLCFLFATAFALSGCFQLYTLLHLEEDGSGTIEETVLVSGFLAQMLQQADTTGAYALLDTERLKVRADSFGAGVRFVRVDTVEESGFEGYRAVYAFKDINKVELSLNDAALPGDASEEAAQRMTSDSPLGVALAFSYASGELTVRVPHADDSADASDEPINPDTLAALTEEISQQAMQQGALMKSFMGDARFFLALTLPSPVAQTNARYIDGDTLTVVDFRFGSFIDLMETDPELIARLQLASGSAERDSVLEALTANKGIRFEAEEEIRVAFE